MQLKRHTKSLILLIALLFVRTPHHLQATQSNAKKLVIPTLAFTFLSNRLMKLSDTKQSGSLLENISKLKISPEKLTQEEMKNLNQYVKQETMQLGKELPSFKDNKKLQSMQNTYKALTSFQQQLAILHNTSFTPPQDVRKLQLRQSRTLSLLPLTQPNNLQQPTLRRPNELLIPADGHCLYTTFILGYLLPVVGNPDRFNQRLGKIVNTEDLPITHKELASHYHHLDYLHSNKGFQQVIRGLLKKIYTKPGTWGGPKEIQLIAEKLNINIQEYTPDPDNPKQLIKGDLTQSKNWLNAPETTLHIVQDTPLKDELINPDHDSELQQGQLSSLQDLQNRHHYRLYYTGTLPQAPPKAPQQQEQQKKENNNLELPEPQNSHQENLKHTFIPPDTSPKPSLPDLLKNHYKAQDELPGMLGDKPQPLESCYIHLAMLTEEAHQVKKEKFLNNEEEKSWNKSMDYGLLHKVQKPIKLEELWKPEENQSQAPRHVVITGEAGTGKSTLSTYMAYQWGKGTLWQNRFQWVLQLPLRKVRDLNRGQSPHDQIATALGIPNFHGSDLHNLLQQDQPGLLILDGYDEVAIEVDKKDNSPLGQWLQPCFENHENLSIILTTRPGPNCPYVKHPRDLRVLGFQQEDIDRYVNTYFQTEQLQNNQQNLSTSKKAQALLHVMQQNPTLKLLSHTPLYLRLLCILAKQQGPQALSKCSTPQLYEQIIAQFLCYNLARHHNKPPTDEEQDLVFKTYGLELNYLGELAFQGMRNSQAVLPVDLQQQLLKKLRLSHPRTSPTEPEHWVRIASLGLLQGYTSSSPKPNQATYFPHLTIQEWLAARYIVTALYDKQHIHHDTAKAIINQDKYAPRYQVMLPFVAGLCYQHICNTTDPQGKGLNAFWTLVNASPRELSGIHHAMLTARCLEACRSDTSSTMPNKLQIRHKTLIQQVASWLQALLNHPFDVKDVDFYNSDASVLLPRLADLLPAGLQGCPRLLSHALITQHVKPAWSELSLEGDKKDESTKHWHARLSKINTLAGLPLSHDTAKQLTSYLQQALQHKHEDVRKVATGALPEVLKALHPQERKAFITPLLNAFKDKHEDVRKAALRALPEMLKTLEPEDALQWLLNAFKDNDSDVRRAAAGALSEVLNALQPQQRKAFFTPLLNALKDKDSYVRSVTLIAVGEVLKALEPQDRKAFITPLLNALNDKKKYLRKAAAWALPEVLNALEPQDRKAFLKPLLNAFKDNDSDVREAMVEALPEVLKALQPQQRKAFFTPLLNALNDKQTYVRDSAKLTLPKVFKAFEPKENKAFITPLLNALNDTDKWVRYAAEKALPEVLNALEPEDRKAFITPLLNALNDTDKWVRYEAAKALPEVLNALEPEDRKAFITPLLNALNDKKENVRYAAAEALPQVLEALQPQQRKTFITPLINVLKDKDSYVRRAAAGALPQVLETLEPHDRTSLVKPFQNLFADKKDDVRDKAAYELPGVLKLLAPQNQKSLLKPFQDVFLADTNPVVRENVSKVLPKVLQALAPQNRKFLVKLFPNALDDKDENVRKNATKGIPEVLKALEAQDRKAFITPLFNALKDTDKWVRYAALRALPEVLKALEPQDRKAFITPFMNTLKDDGKVGRIATQALPGVLQALPPQQRKAFITPFINALNDKKKYLRSTAAWALPEVLKALQPQQRKAFITPFLNALNDKNYNVREAAAKALQKIADKVWKGGLQHQLQAKPQQGLEDSLKEWAYVLLRGSVLVFFSCDEQKNLPSYQMLIKELKEQANTWKWPVHGYAVKALADDFNPSFPKLPAPIIHRAMVYTPLHQAAEKGDMDALTSLWQDSYYHRYLNHQYNKAELTPLLCALQHKQWKAAQWLINQGAWIDVGDIQGNDCLQLVFNRLQQPTKSLEKENLEQQVIILLRKRMLFPMERIKRAIGYGEEKEQSQKTYDHELCATVAQLLGESVDAVSELLHDPEKCERYKGASQNILESTQERRGVVKFTQGWHSDFLRFRIAILFDRLVKIKSEHFITQLPTKGQTNQHYSNDEVYESGVRELQSILTTFWDYKTLMWDYKVKKIAFDKPTFYKAWAQGIVHRMPTLTFPQEMSLYLGHRGHCLYVSLTKTATHYVVRIDNRWLHNDVPSDSHPKDLQTFYNEERDESVHCISLQPYAVAYFPLQTWDKHQSWLLKYIMDTGEVRDQAPIKAITYLYDTKKQAPKKGQKPKWIQQWPWRPLQTTAQNCYMRSHNVGYRIRLGNDVYKWFRKKSLRSYLLERRFIEEQLKRVQPEKRNYPTTLPTHEEVMERFSEQLRVDYNDINMDVVAEEAMVRYAGITNRPQKGARFGRERNTGHTWFKLMIRGKRRMFTTHYEQYHPGAIKNLEAFDEETSREWKCVTFDTIILYHEIIPKLPRSKSISKQQSIPKIDHIQLRGESNTMGSIKRKKPRTVPEPTALNHNLHTQDIIHSKAPLRSQAVVTETNHHLLLQEDTKEVFKEVVHKEDTKQPWPNNIEPNKKHFSKEIPRHQDVMRHFGDCLNVDDNSVLHGTVAQQALVYYAGGITRSQTGAGFGREDQTGRTWFKLRLGSNAFETFMNHYLEHHPGAIRKRKTLSNEWVRITFDTQKLYDEIIPKLKLPKPKPKKQSVIVEKSIEGFVQSITNHFNDEQQSQLMKMLSKKQLPTSSSHNTPKEQGRRKIGDNQSKDNLNKIEDTKEEAPESKKITSSKELPSHQDVMLGFVKQLKVHYNKVYNGIVAQQSLVRYAGLTRTQTGATFGRDNTGRTWFKLRLTSDESEMFMGHYGTLHADAIKKRETLGNGWVRITFDTQRLYDEIIPKLS